MDNIVWMLNLRPTFVVAQPTISIMASAVLLLMNSIKDNKNALSTKCTLRADVAQNMDLQRNNVTNKVNNGAMDGLCFANKAIQY